MDFFIMLLAFAATGVYAWRLFRDNLRIPTFCYVWATSVVILLSGAIYREITGSRARYYDVRGGTHWLTWGQYDGAMLAAAVGIICIALGHYWASHNQWHIPLPEFIDSRAPDAERLRRWAFFLLLRTSFRSKIQSRKTERQVPAVSKVGVHPKQGSRPPQRRRVPRLQKH